MGGFENRFYVAVSANIATGRKLFSADRAKMIDLMDRILTRDGEAM